MIRPSLRLAMTAIFTILVVSGAHSDADKSAESITVIANGEQLLGERRGGIARFAGIPFAQPPTGELRWRSPLPPIPRAGRQSAMQFAPACMQTSYTVDWYRGVMEAFEADPSHAPQPLSVSEDCLYLNIWTSSLEPRTPKPVIVYLHGGNNQGGWSYEPNLHGEAFASRGIVFVSIAYRLHVFGFMAHPELSAESGHSSSGNYGLLDQVMALQWVQRHIARFGGDASNVTLMGESHGAANVGELAASPLTRGLYKNVISQSAGYEINYRDTLHEEEQFGVEFARSLSLQTLAELRALPAQAVLEGAESYYFSDFGNLERYYMYGSSGSHFRKEPLDELYAAGRINPANLLIGVNADERLSYIEETVSGEQLDMFIERYFLAGSQSAVQALLASTPSNRLKMARLSAAQMYVCPVQFQAEAVDSHKLGDAYLYHFSRTRSGPGGAKLGAYHGGELPYVFDTHDHWLPTDETDRALSQTILNYWVNFARTGNPNAENLINWPKYSKGSPLAIELGDTVRVIGAPDRALCALLRPPQPA